MTTSIPNYGGSQTSNQPLLPPPPGVTSDFKSPVSHGGVQIVVTSLLLGITTIFFLNRIYMKTYLVRKYAWDDLTISLAFFGAIAYYIAGAVGIKRGTMGIHDWDNTIAQAGSKNLMIPAYLIAIIPAPTFLFLKLTFLIIYRQVFGPMRWMRISANIGVIITTLFYTTMTVCSLVFTTPRKGETWLYHATSPLEQLNIKFAIPQSCINLVLDLYILILPIVAVARLQMAPRRKIGIILIFLTGILACVGSILSIYYRVQLQRTLDQTWAVIPVMIATLLEMFVGIICACMPAASHTYHHHLRSYESLKKNLKFHYGPLGLKDRSTEFSFPESRSHDIHTSRSVHEGYFSFDTPEHSTPVPAKSLQTSIRNEDIQGPDHGGIHLTYELQQTSNSQPPSTGRWTAV